MQTEDLFQHFDKGVDLREGKKRPRGEEKRL